MKNYVSLLPAEYRREIARERTLGRLRLGLSAICVILLAAAVATGVMRMARLSRLEQLSRENAQAAARIQELSVYQDIKTELDETADKIIRARALEPGWITAVAQITQAMPVEVGLESLASSSAGDQKAPSYALRLDCVASQYESIALTIVALEDSGVVKSARCDSSSEKDGDVSFTLTVELVPPSER